METLNDASGKLTGYKVSLSVRKKAIEPYDPSYDKNYSENKEENFSLEPFSGWEVELYVNAIATDGNEVYRDSAEGRHYRVKIPVRLELPADIKTDLTDENGGKITDGSKYPEDAFDKLSMEYVLQGSGLSGEYKLEAAVYAESYEGNDFIMTDGTINPDFLDENGAITVQPLAPNTDQPCVVVSQALPDTVTFALHKDNLTGWNSRACREISGSPVQGYAGGKHQFRLVRLSDCKASESETECCFASERRYGREYRSAFRLQGNIRVGLEV